MSFIDRINDYINIKKFELYYFWQLTKIFQEDTHYRYLYNFLYRRGKTNINYQIKYNKVINQYEFDHFRFMDMNSLVEHIYTRFS